MWGCVRMYDLPAQLMASMMQDWRCLQGAVTGRASLGVNSIPARQACSPDWVWTKKTIFGRFSGETFHYCGQIPAVD